MGMEGEESVGKHGNSFFSIREPIKPLEKPFLDTISKKLSASSH